MQGRFIVIEGSDKSGKSTQIQLLCEYLKQQGIDCVSTREPGGCPVSEKIRHLLLDRENAMSSLCEAFLYAASRAEHVDKVIRPALDAGRWVVCDRYVDSSIAYQGYGRELGGAVIKKINAIATGGLMPDISFFLQLDAQKAMIRMEQEAKDRLEMEEDGFFGRTASGYQTILQNNLHRFLLIDADGTIQEVHRRLISAFHAWQNRGE